jgi:putative restriction endonuclease
MADLSQALDAIYRLNVGVVGTGDSRHERPHKPTMLLTVLDAISLGFATSGRIEWNDWLRQRFASYFAVVRSFNDSCTPENPFYYLKNDGFWIPIRSDESGERPLEAPPSAADASSEKVSARFTPDWALILSDKAARGAIREAILARYFPATREQLAALIHEEAGRDPIIQETVGRSAAFRRQVLEIYDYQCCACGIRIWIPERDLSFVDAAHVVPFAESRNDHPSNGIALCKNHHWAMDQRLIAPDPGRVWRVSNEIDARRSKGEEELWKLSGQRMLLPAESAYAPDARGLTWRYSRLKSG